MAFLFCPSFSSFILTLPLIYNLPLPSKPSSSLNLMGYLSCNAESAISTCDSYNWDFSKNHTHPQSKHFKVRHFSYPDLETATNAFSQTNFLGKGSHGSVYKATLNGGDEIVAVKKTTSTHQSDNSSANCANSPAENEIETLTRVRSSRLVNLLGFGSDSCGRKLIVVEFMPNGSLYDLLHSDGRPLGWARRVRIMFQVAKAVQHLHLSNPPVIHRDIKSSNVLMDGNWNARLGDFGLALRGHVEDVRVRCTPPAGTLGYLDPAYLAPGDLSTKSDVFSFGILLLEIISGRKAIDMKYSPPSVVDWVAPLIKSGDYIEIFDPRIATPTDMTVIRQLAELAARCVRSTAEKRPTMAEVVECLTILRKKVSSLVWKGLGRRVGRTSPLTNCEPSGETDTSELVKTSRTGSKRNRNRKVSSVTSVELKTGSIGVTKSKSIGSLHEIRFGPLDSNIGRRRGGLPVKMPMVKLSKSRSTGVLQGSGLVHNSNKGVELLSLLGRNPNGREKEESKLLVNSEKEPSLKL